MHDEIDEVDMDVETMLMVGSQLAEQLRGDVLTKSGLTCCAGVANNKMLAKFAANMNKPDSQTTMLPTVAGEFVSTMPLRQLPGVGYKLSGELKLKLDAKVQTAGDLRVCYNLPKLEVALGSKTARWLWSLAAGEDCSEVKNSLASKVVSVEDSFKAATTWNEVIDLLTKLCSELRTRLDIDSDLNDGRRPSSFRVVFRYAKRLRQSRSTAFPAMREQMERVALGLLQQTGMTEPFHLTLLGVGVGSFEAPDASSPTAKPIEKFFHKMARPASTSCPICQRSLNGISNRDINQHIDQCLLR